MNIAVVEDEIIDCQKLVSGIKRYCFENNIFARIVPMRSGEEFLNSFTSGAFDIVFLDIYLKEASGMDVAYKIREKDKDCLLIFATSSIDFAVEGYRVRASGYLVKPYEYDKLKEILKLCDITLLKRARFIEIKESRRMIKVLLSDIVYIDYYNHYVQIHNKDCMHKSYIPFNDIAQRLEDCPQFLRCYRNCMLNMDEVLSIENKSFLMSNGEQLPIARAQHNELCQKYADYAFAKLAKKNEGQE